MKTLRLDDDQADGDYMELEGESEGEYTRPAYLTVYQDGKRSCVGLRRPQLYRLAEAALRIARKA